MISTRTGTYPPGLKSIFPLATLQAFQKDRISFMLKMARYGDVSFENGGALHFYLFNHPDLIQDVLVTHNKNFVKSRGLQASRPVLGNGLLTSDGRLCRACQPALAVAERSQYGQEMMRLEARIKPFRQ
jgi:cytochrome P450